MQDFAYFKSLYPAACKQMQLCVEAVCDELEYEGSPIYDEYPDRIFLEKLTKRALEKWQKVYPAGTERTDTLTTYMKAADVGTVSTEEGTAMVENSLKIDSPGGEREENLAGTSIQPHLPGNDVWYGPLRGEQKGGNAGYMVWEADEPNLTAQERRPRRRDRAREDQEIRGDRRPRRRDRAREDRGIRGDRRLRRRDRVRRDRGIRGERRFRIFFRFY